MFWCQREVGKNLNGHSHIILRGWSHFWTFFLNYWHRWFPFHLDISQKIVIALISAPFKSSLVLCESGAETRNEAYIRISTRIKLTRAPERRPKSSFCQFGHHISLYTNPLKHISSAAYPRFNRKVQTRHRHRRFLEVFGWQGRFSSLLLPEPIQGPTKPLMQKSGPYWAPRGSVVKC